MKRLYIFKKGVLKREGNTLCIQSESDKRYIPVKNVASIYVFSEIQFNKRLLEFLTQNRITLHIFNYYGYYIGSYYPRLYYSSGYMTVKQVEHYLNKEKRIEIAKLIVYGSISNMLSLLKYYRRKGRDLNEEIRKLESFVDEIWNSTNIEGLMGVEGNARKVYYTSWNKIISREGFSFEYRSKRPPHNRLNALISFGNSMLYTTILGLIYRTHLDPRIGYLHETNFRRFTLNLDISEIFKPVIVDRIIFTLINRRMITPDNFSKQVKGIFLKESGRKIFVENFEKRLQESININRKRIKYERLMILELYKLEKHLIGDKNYKPYIQRI
jgi:CRISPR-associated protein Cas1